jgi:hypothetical protein
LSGQWGIRSIAVFASGSTEHHKPRCTISAGDFARGVHSQAKCPDSDCEAWLASVDADDVYSLLDMGQGGQIVQFEQNGHRFGFDDHSWVKSQTNRPLGERSEIERARKSLSAHDLLYHLDYPKSWDSYLALWHCGATIADTPEFSGAPRQG